MKILKIEVKKGYYLNKEGEYKGIESISKEDIYHLIELSIENKVKIDEYVDDSLEKPNEKIIYQNLAIKIKELINQRETILANKNKLFEDAIDKYKK